VTLLAVPEEDLTITVGSQNDAPNDQGGPGSPDPSFDIPIQDSEPHGFIVTEEIARKLLELPFNIMATKRGNHWLLSEPEGDLMTPPLARVIQKYSKMLSEKYPDGVLIFLGLTMSVSARLTIDNVKRRKQNQEAKKGAENEQPEDPIYQHVS
jgi:hypothetical protein